MTGFHGHNISDTNLLKLCKITNTYTDDNKHNDNADDVPKEAYFRKSVFYILVAIL